MRWSAEIGAGAVRNPVPVSDRQVLEPDWPLLTLPSRSQLVPLAAARWQNVSFRRQPVLKAASDVCSAEKVATSAHPERRSGVLSVQPQVALKRDDIVLW